MPEFTSVANLTDRLSGNEAPSLVRPVALCFLTSCENATYTLHDFIPFQSTLMKDHILFSFDQTYLQVATKENRPAVWFGQKEPANCLNDVLLNYHTNTKPFKFMKEKKP